MRDINAKTTDEQIMAGVEYAKQELVKAATSASLSEEMRGSRLVSMAQNVASAEAVAQVSFQYRQVQRNTSGDNARIDFLMSVLLRGSDDGWSGRSNDSRRSSHDAVLAWARDQFDAIRYGA